MADIINTFIQNQTEKLFKSIDNRLNNRFYSPAKNSIDELRSTISSHGGLQRVNQFVLNVPLPEFLRKTIIEDFSINNALSYAGKNIFDGTLGLLCNSINIPGKNLRTQPVKINGLTRNVPMNYNWEEVTATFIDTNDCIIYNTFYRWIDGITNPITNTGKFYDDFVMDLRLDYLNKANEVIGYITLNEAYPISVSRAQSSYNDRGYMTTTVRFTYIYQTNKEYNTSMLYNIVNNLTSGAAAKYLNKATAFLDLYNPIEMIGDSLKSKSNEFSVKGAQNQLKLFT